MNTLWGAGQMMFNKILIVLDRDLDLNNFSAVAAVVCETVNPTADLLFSKGPVDVLDHSSSRFAIGSKIGIDATDKIPGESIPLKKNLFVNRNLLVEDNEISFDFSLAEKGLPVLIAGVEKSRRGQIREFHNRMTQSGAYSGYEWVLYVDSNAATLGIKDLVWLIANNIDPLRDCYFAAGIDEASGPIAIDGTVKTRDLDPFNREWPNIILMNEDVIRQIDRRWDSLGLGRFLTSPSLIFKDLVKNKGAIAAK
jgi:4-hydroxy-3-polyprenylbenzoate decarboxylase